MKTLILGIFTLFVLKTNAQNTNNINALKFKNSVEFEQIIVTDFFEGIKNIEGYNNYTPLKTTFTNNEEPPKELDDEIKDDDYDVKDDANSTENLNDYKNIEILGDLLNVEKTVIIGNWIVKLDLENEKAYVLNIKFSNEYNDLLSSNINNLSSG